MKRNRIGSSLDDVNPDEMDLIRQIIDAGPLTEPSTFCSTNAIYELSSTAQGIEVAIIGNRQQYLMPILGIQAGLDGLELDVVGEEGPDAKLASIRPRFGNDISMEQFDLLKIELTQIDRWRISVRDLDEARLRVVKKFKSEAE